MIFGVGNPEKIWHKPLIHLPTSPVYNHFTLGNPKSHFSTVLFIHTSDYYVISEETNCNCCTAAYLFSYCCLLLPIICVTLFYGQFFLSLWSIIFKATNAKPQILHSVYVYFCLIRIWHCSITSRLWRDGFIHNR